jgi:FtsP/CotA-like multicopper oxidase with cupredoxin domain
MAISFLDKRLGRRRFLKRAGLAGAAIPAVGGLVVSACYDDPTGAQAPRQPGIETKPGTNGGASSTASAGASGGHGGAPSQGGAVNHQMIDADHKKGVEAFLKNTTTPITKGKGNVVLAPRIEGGVKVWDLTMDEVEWETVPGSLEKARGYNNMIPGPIIRATEGEAVRINVKNNLKESSSIHWHGLLIANKMDGVPFITQDPIQPGGTFTYEFTLRNAGTHMYHSHHNALDQVNRGLLGAFIVDPKDRAAYPRADKEVIWVLNDTLNGFTINGKGFPATDAIVAKKGEKVIVRMMNEGLVNHPMHLHGMPMLVFAKDGYPMNPPQLCDTIDVAPGNRYDCLIECTEEGAWAFHCHVLSHAEGPGGMFGLVTALVVAPA